MCEEVGTSMDCLCCNASFTPKPIIKDQIEVEILSDLFSTFSRHIGWESTQKNRFNFSVEQFPFCSPCRIQLVRVFKLDQQIQAVISDLTSKIIYSEQRLSNNSNNQPCGGTEKTQFYRKQTISKAEKNQNIQCVGTVGSSHNSNQLHNCTLCQSTFKLKYSLLMHMSRVHAAEYLKKFGCVICGRKYTQQWLLNEHARVHCKFPCLTCGKIFSKSGIYWHMRSHSKNRTPSSTTAAATSATTKTSSPPDTEYGCKICLKNFSSPSLLSSHEQSCGENTSCSNNGGSSTGTISRKKQRREGQIPLLPSVGTASTVNEEDGNASNRCEICGKIFSSRSCLKIHVLKFHTLEKDKAFRCRVCGQKFAIKSLLKKHFGVHEKVECDICNDIVSVNSLYRHKYFLHKSWECTLCNKSFPVASSKDHVSWHKVQNPGARLPGFHYPGSIRRRRESANTKRGTTDKF